ncbi:hypothetical protein Agub_g5727 [Astrephomene gubernaculifera]|uniref:Channelopsin 1 n=1 Tax=Astrephomene gubernaculifera TaxID=47775 RepID=A0AAD3HL03_9CHLO|nr:hypothetical protein Agub_g5727 [Astrephomene gubernaculifera]
MDHPVARSLASGFTPTYYNLGNGSVIVPENECFCMEWTKSKGSDIEMKVANGLQWAAFALSVVILIFYAYETWKTTCGWEEVYVCCLELTKVIIEFFHEFDTPCLLHLSSGNRVLWLRYSEWLMTCPVILIHLSNLTGLKNDYNKRTMRLLVSDIGTIVWGATAAMSTGYVRAIFFVLGCMYGANTFFHAAKVYIESYHTVPKGRCRLVVRAMAWLFFASWGMFPVLFLLGPEGFGHISLYGSTIGHTVIDLMSKNGWGMLGHYLRVKIHEHILLYGDIRKTTKIKVAGEELEVETMVAEEDEDTVKKGTGQYASRESFIVMRDKLKEKGYEVRASLDASGVDNHNPPAGKAALEMGKMQGGGGLDANMMGGMGGVAGGMPSIAPGRVILAVPDISMVDFFREQFAQLPVPYEVVPALGVDNTLQLVQQAAALGGCDFVLMHPEFLRDRSPAGLAGRLRTMGQRTAAFGWAQLGPVRDLIESSGLDGWLEGPSFGAGVSLQSLAVLIARMQQKKMAAMMGGGMMGGGMGMGGMGMGGGVMGGAMGMMNPAMGMAGGMGMGMGGMGSMGSMGMQMGAAANAAMLQQQQQQLMMGMGNNGNANAMGGSGLASPQQSGLFASSMGQNAGAGGAAANGGMLQHQMSGLMNSGMQSPGSTRIGTNPLFNAAPSPLSSQPGEAMGGGAAAAAAGGAAASGPLASPAAGAAGGGAAGGASEAEMLMQLMNEINRLKSELGEQH